MEIAIRLIQSINNLAGIYLIVNIIFVIKAVRKGREVRSLIISEYLTIGLYVISSLCEITFSWFFLNQPITLIAVIECFIGLSAILLMHIRTQLISKKSFKSKDEEKEFIRTIIKDNIMIAIGFICAIGTVILGVTILRDVLQTVH